MAKPKDEEKLLIQRETFIDKHTTQVVLLVSFIIGGMFIGLFWFDRQGDLDSEYTEESGKEVAEKEGFEFDNTNNSQVEDMKERFRMDGPYTFRIDVRDGFIEISWIDYFVFALLSLFLPYGTYMSKVNLKRKAMEDKFPDFMRDLAEFWKGGLSMTKAVDTLAEGEYGALNDEVKKMSQQLSWGVEFGEVIQGFATRVKSGTVERSVALVQEANKAGGEISDILLTVSNDAREIRILYKEKEGVMASYVSIILTAFGIYALIIASMVMVFVPAIAGSTNDLDMESTSFGGVSIKEMDPALVTLIFFFSVLVQGMGSGLNAGVMGNGTISDGLRQAARFTFMGWAFFELLGITNDVKMGVA